MGCGEYVTVATAIVEIRHGPFAISSQVNGACSCFEGERKIVREAV